MGDTMMFRETVAQREGLVEVLADLSEAERDEPSLCAGWRIREVVAHITMPYRHSGRTILGVMVRARGRFDVAADRLARQDTQDVGWSQLLECLRQNVDHRWKPPGARPRGRRTARRRRR